MPGRGRAPALALSVPGYRRRALYLYDMV